MHIEMVFFLVCLVVVCWQYKEIRRLKNELSFDPLTGLKIMNNFEKKCLEVVDRVERKRDRSISAGETEHVAHRKERTTHCIAFVDMDGLQWTNNHPDHGYIIGDRVLVALANILNRWRRQDDVIFRRSKGGDEFILILPCATKEKAEERILLVNRKRFEEVIAKRFPGLAGKVSFSFGVREINLNCSEEDIAFALDDASKDMHSWKEQRKMDRTVSCLSDC